MKPKRMTAATVLFILLSGLALADTIQLLAPSKGWALNNGRLLWTSDNGEHWNDITPDAPGVIASVFFMDESQAWVLLRSDASDDLLRFELAGTTDGGHTWSRWAFPIPRQYSGELSGAAWLDFADAQHGWVMLRKASSSAFSLGRLFSTQDGGHVWRELPQPPLGEPVSFVSPSDGFIAGNSGYGGIYRSGDGGKTWEGIDLPDPDHSVPTRPAYGQLRFTDAKHGSVPIIFSAITDQTRVSRLVLFTTVDARNWKVDRVQAMSRNMYGESPFPSVLVGTVLVSAPGPRLTRLDASAGSVSTVLKGVRSDITVKEASFTDSTHGWLRLSDDRILSTTDGGETLRWLIPRSTESVPTSNFFALPVS